MATGQLLGEQPTRIYSAPGCPQPLHILRTVARYGALVWACVVEIDEWIMCAQSFCLFLDLYTRGLELNLDRHNDEEKEQGIKAWCTHIIKKTFSSGDDGLVVTRLTPSGV